MLASIPTYRRASLEYESIADNNVCACGPQDSWKNRLVDYCVELAWKDPLDFDSDGEDRDSGSNQKSASVETRSEDIQYACKPEVASSSSINDRKIQSLSTQPEQDDETVSNCNQVKSHIRTQENPFVLHRYPQDDHADFSFPDGISYFCIPHKQKDNMSDSTSPPVFSFLMTSGDGTRVYGFVVNLPQMLDDGDINETPTESRVLCLISHHPLFSLLSSLTTWIHRVIVETMMRVTDRWSLLVSIFDRIIYLPTLLPTMGQDVCLHLSYSPPFGAKCRDWEFDYQLPRGKLPYIEDYCYHLLFRCLSLDHIVYLVNCLLLEQRVLLHSNDQETLTPVCEALKSLMFPFTWEHVYIPFLPLSLIDYLHAPMPYLIGIQSSALCAREINGEVLTSCVVVHLDKNRVIAPMRWSYHQSTCTSSELTRLPSHAVNILIDTINGDEEVPHPRQNDKRSLPSTTTHKRTRVLKRLSRRRKSTRTSVNFELHRPFTRLEEVTCSFSGGALGITFEEFKGPSAAPAIVREFPKFASGRVGPAERSGVVKIGSLLVAINNVAVLGWSFRHTIRLLQQAPRPVLLRFWSPSDRENVVASSIRRIKSEASLSNDKPLGSDGIKRYERRLSNEMIEVCERKANRILPWVDGVRASFAVLFTSLLHHVDSFVRVESLKHRITTSREADHRDNLMQNNTSQFPCSVHFDDQGFLNCSALSSQDFLQDFVNKQAFVEFINDLALEKVSARNDCYRRITLFKQLLHLFHESEHPKLAITLLIERQFEMIESRSEDVSIQFDTVSK